jgi:hypothetical protein
MVPNARNRIELLTSALVPAVLNPGNHPPILIEFEAGWTLEPVLTIRGRGRFLDSAGNLTTSPWSSSP